MRIPTRRHVSQIHYCLTGWENELYEGCQSLTIINCDTLEQGQSSMTCWECPTSFLGKHWGLCHPYIKTPNPQWRSSYVCGLMPSLSTEGPPLEPQPQSWGKRKNWFRTSWLQFTKVCILECWEKEKLGYQSSSGEVTMPPSHHPHFSGIVLIFFFLCG